MSGRLVVGWSIRLSQILTVDPEGPHAFQRPEADEFVMVVLASGLGESQLIHMPGHGWIVVDTFPLTDTDPTPAAISYLERIGVSPLDVASIVITHWHMDHMDGLAGLVSRCAGAEVYATSVATDKRRFLALAAAHDLDDKAFARNRGAAEILAASRVLGKDRKAGRFRGFHFLNENKPLFMQGRGVVTALSPSGVAEQRGRSSLMKALRDADNDDGIRLGAASTGENEGSVALHIVYDNVDLMLGADLEIGQNRDLGWRRVVTVYGDETWTSSVFKVSHHGSAESHHNDAWDALLTKPIVVSIVTPYCGGDVLIPTTADLARIKSGSTTAVLAARGYVGLDMGVQVQSEHEALASDVTEAGWSVGFDLGYVRVAQRSGETDWTVSIAGEAVVL